MYVTPRDSRQRYTKQCLFDAFERSLASKAVSEIRVNELCADAGISRKTFYKYYSDPFALLLAMQEDLFIGFGERLSGLAHDVYTITPELIRFAGEHRVLVRAVFANRGEDNLIDRTVAWLYETYHADWERANPGLSSEDVRFLFRFVVAGLVGILQLWLFDCPEMAVEEVCARAEALMRLATPQTALS